MAWKLMDGKEHDPSRVVAQGAAIQAGVLNGKLKDTLLLDIVPISLGFTDHRGEFIRVVERGTPIPISKGVCSYPSPVHYWDIDKIFPGRSTHINYHDFDADSLIKIGKIKIMQGDYENASDNLLLGEFPIDFGTAPPHQPNALAIAFDIYPAPDVKIIVTVKDPLSGAECKQEVIAIDPFSREDIKNQDLTVVRAQANELLNVVDAAVKAHGDHIHPDILRRIGEAREGLQRAMQSRDATELVGALAVFSELTNMKPSPHRTYSIPPSVVTKATAPSDTIFICYARADRAWLDRLRVHLVPLERDGKVEIWHDGKIKSGTPWQTEIQQALRKASAAILLVTANFMASNFIYENELPPILERNRASGLFVFPVFVGNCHYQHDRTLSRLQAFNDPRRPISAMTEAEVDAEFARLAGVLWDRFSISS